MFVKSLIPLAVLAALSAGAPAQTVPAPQAGTSFVRCLAAT